MLLLESFLLKAWCRHPARIQFGQQDRSRAGTVGGVAKERAGVS
jgi:hypothetical protein